MRRHPFSRAVDVAVGVAERALSKARRRMLGTRVDIAPTAVLYHGSRIVTLEREGAIRIGANTHIRGELLVAAHGGSISIGEWCFVGEGTRIWSARAIEIGNRVLVSHDCEIHDWNAHSLDPRRRHAQFRAIVESGHPPELVDVPSAPVRIGDDAWIGFGSAILKGVSIGARSVVAARSLVLEDVPSDVLVAGSPARIIKQLASPGERDAPVA
jgi:acetyltransferase-like isoleucine patch superfamily enzyme